MLYKKNGSARLSQDLFRQPTAEYRGTPFWAWNCKLEQKEPKNRTRNRRKNTKVPPSPPTSISRSLWKPVDGPRGFWLT